MMFAWVLGTPLFFIAMVLVLDWLERCVVAPEIHAARISYLIESEHPEELEHVVATLLAPVADRPRPVVGQNTREATA